jgi:hypothetical protein
MCRGIEASRRWTTQTTLAKIGPQKCCVLQPECSTESLAGKRLRKVPSRPQTPPNQESAPAAHRSTGALSVALPQPAPSPGPPRLMKAPDAVHPLPHRGEGSEINSPLTPLEAVSKLAFSGANWRAGEERGALREMVPGMREMVPGIVSARFHAAGADFGSLKSAISRRDVLIHRHNAKSIRSPALLLHHRDWVPGKRLPKVPSGRSLPKSGVCASRASIKQGAERCSAPACPLTPLGERGRG